jgi:hypothetical protein
VLTFPAGLSRGFPLEWRVEFNDSGREQEHVTADIYSGRDRGEERPRRLSRPESKKIKRPGLEHLVADGEIVIAARNHKRLRARQ